MNQESHDDWEEKLRARMSELPQERMPSALLEERTVRELRRRGILRRPRRRPSAWLVGSIAASLVLFATGIVVGQYLGTRSTMNVFAQMEKRSAYDAAAHVQQTGSAYVQALEALVNASQTGKTRGQDAVQAREVALTALHEAANEFVRLAPNDPVAAKILQGIQQERTQNQARNGRSAGREIVWF